jgi:hypothetical protein
MCPAGSMVLWDSRTMHSCTGAVRGRAAPNIRNIAYISYEPRSYCTPAALRKRINAFRNQRNTTHWPCNPKLLSDRPSARDDRIEEIEPLPYPELSRLGYQLVGYPPYYSPSDDDSQGEEGEEAEAYRNPTLCAKCECRAKFRVDGVLLCGRHCKHKDRTEDNLC